MAKYLYIVSSILLFVTIYCSNKTVKLTGSILATAWFVLCGTFSFTQMTFLTNINYWALAAHIGCLAVVLSGGYLLKTRKYIRMAYSIVAILLWSMLVDTADYFFFFPQWHSGLSYFSYLLNGLVFNLPKCYTPAIIGGLILIWENRGAVQKVIERKQEN